jgi:hypothetical protein
MMTRYLSGLCVAGLGVCGGGWLVVAAVAFSGADGGGADSDAGRVNLATGAGLIVVCCVTAVAWAVAWRRRMRADGVLGERFATVSRRQARRNRRELKRDVRRAARTANQAAREARRRARRFPRLADGELTGGGLGDRGLGGGLGGSGLGGRGLGGSGLGGGGLGGGGLGGGGLGGGLTGTGPLASGLSGGGLGEPRGWIGGGRLGYAPHGPSPVRPRSADPSTTEVLVELRTLRSLLTPLIEATAPQPAVPPLPQRQPGQERPRIPRKRADQPGGEAADQPGGEAADQPGGEAAGPQGGETAGPAGGEAAEQADGAAASGQPGGLLAGEGELLRLADSEEAWW